MKRTVSVKVPTPAVQRLKMLSFNATTGNCGTAIKLMTPMRKKLPVTSRRTSSHKREHCKSGRIRVGCISVEVFRRPHRILHQHGNGHWPDATRIGRDFAGDGLHPRKI